MGFLKGKCFARKERERERERESDGEIPLTTMAIYWLEMVIITIRNNK